MPLSDISLNENSRLILDANGANYSLAYKSATVDDDGGEVDAGSNRSGGFSEVAPGLATLRCSGVFQYRRADNPFAVPPYLASKTFVDDVHIIPDINQPTVMYALPIAYFNKVSMQTAAGGDVEFTVSFRNHGEYTTPGG